MLRTLVWCKWDEAFEGLGKEWCCLWEGPESTEDRGDSGDQPPRCPLMIAAPGVHSPSPSVAQRIWQKRRHTSSETRWQKVRLLPGFLPHFGSLALGKPSCHVISSPMEMPMKLMTKSYEGKLGRGCSPQPSLRLLQPQLTPGMQPHGRLGSKNTQLSSV